MLEQSWKNARGPYQPMPRALPRAHYIKLHRQLSYFPPVLADSCFGAPAPLISRDAGAGPRAPSTAFAITMEEMTMNRMTVGRKVHASAANVGPPLHLDPR
jgi:hypothetical protein